MNKPFHFTKNRKPFLLTWTWTSRTLCAFSKPILPLPKELPESKYLPLRACSPRQCPPNFFPRPTLLRTASYRSPAFAQEKITLSPSPYIPPSLPPLPDPSTIPPLPYQSTNLPHLRLTPTETKTPPHQTPQHILSHQTQHPSPNEPPIPVPTTKTALLRFRHTPRSPPPLPLLFKPGE